MSALDDIYAAIEDDAALQALPDSIARACGARSGSIQVGNPSGGWHMAAVSWFSPDQMRSYGEVAALDPWPPAGIAASRHQLAAGLDELVPPDALVNTEFYQRFIASHGDDTARCMGAMRSAPNGLMVAVHRPLGGPAFDAADEAVMAEIFGHTERVLRLRRLLDQAGKRVRELESLLTVSGVAVTLVGRDLKVRAASVGFLALCEARDGLAVRQDRLVLADGEAQGRLASLVANMLDHVAVPSTAFQARRPSLQRPYRLLALPAGPGGADGVVLVIDDPAAASRSQLDWLVSLYRLSPAETAIVAGLMAGRTLDEVAAARGSSVMTVRTQLRQVLAKTDTNRQSELMALMARLPRPVV